MKITTRRRKIKIKNRKKAHCFTGDHIYYEQNIVSKNGEINVKVFIYTAAPINHAPP